MGDDLDGRFSELTIGGSLLGTLTTKRLCWIYDTTSLHQGGFEGLKPSGLGKTRHETFVSSQRIVVGKAVSGK